MNDGSESLSKWCSQPLLARWPQGSGGGPWTNQSRRGLLQERTQEEEQVGRVGRMPLKHGSCSEVGKIQVQEVNGAQSLVLSKMNEQ